MGMQAGLSKEDHVATSYRCHGNQYFRGGSVKGIISELFGFEQGDSKGKGGSMHLYSKSRRFWGGAGIVGAQIPIAGGLAFMEKNANQDLLHRKPHRKSQCQLPTLPTEQRNYGQHRHSESAER